MHENKSKHNTKYVKHRKKYPTYAFNEKQTPI